MRLWHKDLIKVLPREQLVAQWRELSAIAGNINEKGAPNHILVNKIMDYGLWNFISYAYHVRAEMTKREYKTMNKVWDKICSVDDEYDDTIYPIDCFIAAGTMIDILNNVIIIFKKNMIVAALEKKIGVKFNLFI